jgi:hypothetical protein
MVEKPQFLWRVAEFAGMAIAGELLGPSVEPGIS